MKNIILNQRAERDELMARPYQQRDTRYNFDELLSNPLIKLITGPRRVGKSVFALLMLQGRNFAYLNFDDNLLLENWDEDLVMQMLDDVYPGYEYLLLDEIQNLPDWDLWVNKLYRRGKNLIITGSNAKMLSREMATVLTGRYLQIEMLPFSLEETMRWRNVNPNLEEQSAQAVVVADDYMRNGGYPETIQSRNITKSYLSTLFDSILLKDVAKRHKVRNTTDLYNLATYLLSNFCNPISAKLSYPYLFQHSSSPNPQIGYLSHPDSQYIPFFFLFPHIKYSHCFYYRKTLYCQIFRHLYTAFHTLSIRHFYQKSFYPVGSSQ